jgi:hypothetical protein
MIVEVFHAIRVNFFHHEKVSKIIGQDEDYGSTCATSAA